MAGTPNVGTLVGAAIRPINTADLISTAYANEIKGGIHGYATITERDSIIIQRREWGMLVVVYNDPIPSNNKTYQLKYNNVDTDLMNLLNWVEYTGASSTNISEWQNSVKSILSIVPTSPNHGDRYLVGIDQYSSVIGSPWAGNPGGFISEYNSTTTNWTNTYPTDGMTVRVDDQDNSLYKYEGTYSTGIWNKEKLTQVYSTSFTGDGVNYTTTTTPQFISYESDTIFLSKFNVTNTSTIVKVNINGLGLLDVKKPSINGLVDLYPGEIQPDNIYSLTYDLVNNCFQFFRNYSNDAINIKYYIEPNDYIVVPPYCQYWVYGDLTVDGTIVNYGQVIVANGELIIGTSGVVQNFGDVDLITIGGGNSNVDFSAIDGHLIPSAGDTYDIGATAGYNWRDLYLSGTTIYLGDSTISSVGGEVLFNGNPAGIGTTGSVGATGAPGDRYSTTSSDTFSIPEVGITRDFLIGTDLAYTPSQTIIVSPNLDPNDHFHAIINSYYPLTGSMSVTCTEDNNIAGETYSAWTINLSGAVGVPGEIGPTGATGPTYVNIIFTHAAINPVNDTNYTIGRFSQIQPYNITTNKGSYISQYSGTITDVSIIADFTGGSTESSTFTISNETQGTSSIIDNTINYLSASSNTTIFNEALTSGVSPVGWIATGVTFVSGYAYFVNVPTATLDTSSFSGTGYDTITVTTEVAKFGTGTDGPLTIQYSIDGGSTWLTAGNTSIPTSSTYLTSTVTIPTTSSTMKIRVASINTTSQKRLRNFVAVGVILPPIVQYNYTLSNELPVNSGDIIKILWSTPTWLTPPTSVVNLLDAKLKLL